MDRVSNPLFLCIIEESQFRLLNHVDKTFLGIRAGLKNPEGHKVDRFIEDIRIIHDPSGHYV